MTTPLDSRTPLILVSELRARMNADSTKADVNSRLLDTIIQWSQGIQAICNRRFDEYLETRYFTPFHISQNGDLLGMRELRLDADLKSASSIINGDASPINMGNVQLLPLNAPNKEIIRLNPYGIQFWYHAGVTDPKGSIQVTGTWGYGGRWFSVGTVGGTGFNDTATTFTSSVALEAGMTLKIGSEYLYLRSTSGTTNTVERAFNGSVAASHAQGDTIYRFEPIEVIRRALVRLAQVALSQDNAPLYGQQVVGDLALPVTTDTLPKDVLDLLRNAKVVRAPRIQGV